MTLWIIGICIFAVFAVFVCWACLAAGNDIDDTSEQMHVMIDAERKAKEQREAEAMREAMKEEVW